MRLHGTTEVVPFHEPLHRLMRLHIRAQDRVDAGLISTLAAEPAEQVGVEPMVTISFGQDAKDYATHSSQNRA
jgi:hypothetical protein